jgi:hypothetical protein
MAADRQNNTNEPPEIEWDESGVHDVFADFAQATGTREEIMLLFGERRKGAGNPDEIRVRLKERVVLGAPAAKRFAALLDRAVRDHEAQYGPQTPEPGNAASSSIESKSAPAGGAADGGPVIEQVDSLDIQYGFERSFKMVEQTLLENRFLLGFKKKRIQGDAHGRILDICRQLGMPERLLVSYRERLPDANYLHFGFEENETTCLFKAYLEFYEKFEEQARRHPGPPGPFLMHLGFKWDARDPGRQAITSYVWHPLLSVEEIAARVSEILPPRRFGKISEIAKQIVAFVARILHPHDILYLEVTEEDNPRRSFDINMYRANLAVGALVPFLEAACLHYGISLEKFQDLYEGIKTKRFGHISGGIGREGKDFFTVYYGVEYTGSQG